MSSAMRVLETLNLFTLKRPTWTPEQAATALHISRASAYRYFALLAQSRFIETVSGRGYSLGSAIVELDRQIRLSDPLVQSSVDVMVGLARSTGGAILLCRLYKGRVLCVHQESGTRVPAIVSYERGRPMPLYRGATSKAILAFLPPRSLEALVERDRKEMGSGRLPGNGADLWRSLEGVRRNRLSTSHGEIDPGACGAAVPLFERSRVVGSLSVVLPSAALGSGALDRAARLLVKGGYRIETEFERAVSRVASRKRGATP